MLFKTHFPWKITVCIDLGIRYSVDIFSELVLTHHLCHTNNVCVYASQTLTPYALCVWKNVLFEYMAAPN